MSAIREQARSHGIQLSYRDVWGRTRRASDEALKRVLQSMACAESSGRERVISPVIVAWDGDAVALPNADDASREFTLVTEDGQETSWRTAEPTQTPRLPLGYHQLFVTEGGRTSGARVIAAPRRAPVPPKREWGVFLPLHALRTARSPAVADLGDLEALAAWTSSLGGKFVGTLPIFSAFLDEPFDPSPYAPVSRLFWNELYLDVTRTPEYGRCPEARNAGGPKAGELVDFRQAYSWKRGVLSVLADEFFRTDGRRADLDAFLASNPHADGYARFRTRSGGSYEMHLYAQLVMHEQLRMLSGDLYLDLPLGVHPEGYDAAAFDVFASGVSAGAPPDGFFAGGQNWGCPPLHPSRSRAEGHDYFARCIRTVTARANALRVDHVMGLHRLFWIPDGMDAADGVYVRYPADELYAVLTLEAHRNDCVLVGEDLGTVPRGVRTTMRSHGILRSHVFQFEPDSRPPDGSLASLNTHDTPTFAQWAEAGTADLRSSLRELAAGPARVVVVNLEDLWGEDRPQNVPGTGPDEHPNWRRKASRSFEEFADDPEILDLLTEINDLRRTA